MRDIFGDVNFCLRYAEDLKLVFGQSRGTLGHELAFVWNTTIHGMYMPVSSLNKYFNIATDKSAFDTSTWARVQS